MARSPVIRMGVRPRWGDGDTFWYRVVREIDENGAPIHEVVSVDCDTRRRTVLEDVPWVKLSHGWSERATDRTGDETRIEVVNDTSDEVSLWWLSFEGAAVDYGSVAAGERVRQHTYAGHRWLVRDREGNSLGVFVADEVPGRILVVSTERPTAALVSPNGRLEAKVHEGDIHLTIRGRLWNKRRRLTWGGQDGVVFESPSLQFSPDSRRLLALQLKRAETRRVTLIEAAPEGGGKPKRHSFPYAKPGDDIDHPRPVLFDMRTREAMEIDDTLFANPWELTELMWNRDSRRFTFLYNERGHRVVRLIEVDADTGVARCLVEERSETFVDYAYKLEHRFLENGDILWLSERDGHNHLYLFSGDGELRAQLTRGELNVRSIEHVDEARSEVLLIASGVSAERDPYHRHLCRVGLDGTGFIALTDAEGDHEVFLSPTRRYFVGVHSRVDLPPVAELRETASGERLMELEAADASRPIADGWSAPERFVAKGRDGVTDIHGVIVKPRDFDPLKRFPVLEEIYASPSEYFVPKRFSETGRWEELADLGFVVVVIDGMGTNWRSKQFHDVAYKNLHDAGFPDRKKWIAAAAATRPWMDLSRVGIFGGSAGGQSAVRALIDHSDFYSVAVADCGCHDNRLDKIWWNELWMGWPVGPAYEAASNIVHAGRVEGQLMLIVGELDRNVDPIATMDLAAALEKAGKEFELVVIRGAGHGAAETPEGRERREAFLVKHLVMRGGAG